MGGDLAGGAPVGDGSEGSDAAGSGLAVGTQSLDVGECFYSATDEGMWMVYRVTSENTVEVGHGSAGESSVVNVPPTVDADGREHVQRFPTTDTNYDGAITIPETVRYGGTTYTVTSISSGAFGVYGKDGGLVYYHFSSIEIPETVTSIGSSAFNGHLGLGKGVSFAGTPAVTEIGASAFAGSNIRSFQLPETVTSIGSSAFARSMLGTFEFPAESELSYLPDYLFYDTRLSELQVPRYISIIGNYAFSKTYIRDFVLPFTVRSFGNGLFSGSMALRSFEFEEGTPITELPAYTFEKCGSFTSYEFPWFIRSVEAHCFDGAGLADVTIPKTLTYLGDYAFANCSGLMRFAWEDGHQLLNINPGLLANTRNLRAIVLPGNIRSIGAHAFEGSGLAGVRIPAKVKSLGEFAFQQCQNLGYVLFEGDASKLSSSPSTFYLSPNVYACVYYGKRSKNVVFRSAMNVTTYCAVTYYRLRGDVGSDRVFGRYCVPLGQVPSALESTSAFEGLLYNAPTGTNWVCEQGFSLDSEMAESFYAYAQPIVSDLKAGNTFVAETIEKVPVTYTVVKPATATSPGTAMVGEALGNLRNSAVDAKTTGAITLSSQVTGPDANAYNVTSIAPYAFANCNKFVTLTIPAGITTIGSHAFYRCTTLRNVFFDSDANKIKDDDLFAGCTNIRLVVFGGKKANVSFGSSSPAVYYTVFFYDTEHDYRIGHVDERLVVRERAKIGSLKDSQVRSGAVPELKVGYEWRYEDGFGPDIPLEDSCWVYQEGMGFQYQIRVLVGNAAYTPCWFKITRAASGGRPGEVQVGLGKDGITAVHTGLTGIPIIPEQVTDADGNAYNVTSIGDFAFGSANYFDACVQIISVQMPFSIQSIGESAYRNCIGLTNLVLPSGLERMGTWAFAGCIGMSSCDLSRASRLGAIAAHAFDGDYRLGGAVVPAGVTSIENDAFANCYIKLQEGGGEQVYGMRSADLSQAPNLQTIGARAFYNNRLMNVRQLTLPEGFRDIGANAFYFTGVQNLTLPASIESIGESAFRYSNLQTITFNGDARNVEIGSQAFNLYYNYEQPGSLTKVTFMDKRREGFESYVNTGVYEDRLNNNYRRTYNFYYNIRMYRNRSAFNAGRSYSNLVLKEDSIPAQQGRLSLKRGQAWDVEEGFALARRIQNSFYVVMTQDIAFAKVTGVQESYDYTGFSIKPVPVLTMPGGVVLVQGRDYVFDPAFSGADVGYTNNRRMGTAGIHLKGIGDYGGTKSVTFTILPFYDGDEAIKDVRLSDEGPFTYNGQPHEPGVVVTAEVKGNERELVRDVEFVVQYSDNVNAGTGTAQVRGAGVFAGGNGDGRVLSFAIDPLDIRECDFRTVSVKANALGVVQESSFEIYAPWGDLLVEGRDYETWISPVMLGGRGTVMISGIGNYTGSWSGTFGPRGGGDEGDPGNGPGNGDGPGDGPGNGDGDGNGGRGDGNGRGDGSGNGRGTQAGTGNATANGRGASPTTGISNSTAQVSTAPMFGGARQQVVAGEAGSEAGGSSEASGGGYRLYELSSTEPDIVLVEGIPTAPWWLILLVALLSVLVGVARRSAENAQQHGPVRSAYPIRRT